MVAVSAGLAVSWESVQGISQTNDPPVEFSQGVSQTTVPPWDAGGGVNQAAGVSWESAGPVFNDTSSPWESLLGVSQSNVPPAEFLQGVYQEEGIFWETKGVVTGELVIPWEASRTEIVSNTPPVTVEVLQGLRPSPEIFWEAKGRLSVSVGTPVEWLLSVQQTQGSESEFLLGLSPTLGVAWETEGRVFSAPTIFWESLGQLLAKEQEIEWESAQILHLESEVPLESLQGAVSAGSVFWDSRGLLTVGPEIIVEFLLTVVSGAAGGPSGITMISDGLINLDDFNRPDSATVGGGWTEDDTSFEIDSLQLLDTQAVWSNGDVWRSTPALPATGYVLQSAIRIAVNGNFGGICTRKLGGADTSYYCGFSNVNDAEITKYVSGGVSLQDLDGVQQFLAATWYGVRMSVEASGPSLALTGLFTIALASSDDLTEDFVQRVQITDGSPLSDTGRYGFTKYREVRWDDHIAMGNASGGAIMITGLPSGYKLQVGSRPAVVESGGTATIPLSTWREWAFPETTVKVLDASDVEVASLSPPGGFYGGASFSFAPVGTPIGEVSWESLTGLEPDFTVPLEILGSSVKVEQTPWEVERGLRVPASPFWEARGRVSPSSVTAPWESLLHVEQEEVVDWATAGFASNDGSVFWEAEGETSSARSTEWESRQSLRQTDQTPWESLFGSLSVLDCPWESSQALRRASNPLYERLQGISRSKTPPWEAKGKIGASEVILVEVLLGIQSGMTHLWEAGSGVANLVIPFWESRGPVFESVETLHEILQGGSGQTVSVETLYEILLGVRNTITVPYEVLPGLGTIVGPTVTLQRGKILRPTRAALPFPEASPVDPVTGALHDPERAIIGPPQPVSSLLVTPWESIEELIDESLEFVEASLSVFGGTLLFGDVPGKKIRVLSYVATRASGTPSARIRFREASIGPIIYEIGPLGNGISFFGSNDLPAFETAAGAELHASLAGGVPFQNVFIHMAIVRV